MKKLGFTLAEVLITLGIIGVVAALTAPALVQNAGSAQIGPKLAKAVSTFETANEKMLMELGINTVKSIGGDGEELSSNYGDQLTNYMKMSFYDDINGSKYGGTGSEDVVVTQYDGSSAANTEIDTMVTGTKYLSKDGFLYAIAALPFVHNSQEALYKQITGWVAIDINGLAQPNRAGKDVFIFALMQDGTLQPYGSQALQNDAGDDLIPVTWDEGNDLCNETTVGTGLTCAGSIFDNNLKVIYQ